MIPACCSGLGLSAAEAQASVVIANYRNKMIFFVFEGCSLRSICFFNTRPIFPTAAFLLGRECSFASSQRLEFRKKYPRDFIPLIRDHYTSCGEVNQSSVNVGDQIVRLRSDELECIERNIEHPRGARCSD